MYLLKREGVRWWLSVLRLREFGPRTSGRKRREEFLGVSVCLGESRGVLGWIEEFSGEILCFGFSGEADLERSREGSVRLVSVGGGGLDFCVWGESGKSIMVARESSGADSV